MTIGALRISAIALGAAALGISLPLPSADAAVHHSVHAAHARVAHHPTSRVAHRSYGRVAHARAGHRMAAGIVTPMATDIARARPSRPDWSSARRPPIRTTAGIIRMDRTMGPAPAITTARAIQTPMATATGRPDIMAVTPAIADTGIMALAGHSAVIGTPEASTPAAPASRPETLAI
jgi:hypothetical protein